MYVFDKINSFSDAYYTGLFYFGNSELLFWRFSYLFKWFGLSSDGYVITCATISFVLTTLLVKFQVSELGFKNSSSIKEVAIIILIICGLFSSYQSVYFGNHIRASLAIPLGFLSVMFFINKKVITGISLFLFSVGLHWSCIVFLIFPLAHNILNSYKRIFGMYVLCILAAILSSVVVSNIINFSSSFSGIMSFIGDKAEVYQPGSDTFDLKNIFVTSAFWIIFLVATFFILDPRNVSNRLKANSLCCLFLVMSLSFSPMMSMRYLPFLYLTSVSGFYSSLANYLGRNRAVIVFSGLYIILTFVVIGSQSVRKIYGI